MKGSPSAEAFVSQSGYWEEALRGLRKVFLEAGMEETIKWGIPVYTHKGRNVAGMALFKAYAGIWFYQGSFLSDPGKKLISAQEGITKGLRQWRFYAPAEVLESLPVVLDYSREAMLNAERGVEIKPARKSTPEMPGEMKKWLDTDAELRERFDSLSPTCRREYIEYIATARQDKTRVARMVKIAPMILGGAGLNDKYKKQNTSGE